MRGGLTEHRLPWSKARVKAVVISSAPSNLQSGDNWDLWENLSQPINAPRDPPPFSLPNHILLPPRLLLNQ